MTLKKKMGAQSARKGARFKLLTSTTMVAMALLSMSAKAGTGSVTLADGSKIGTYYANSPKLRKFVDTLPGLSFNPNRGANTFDAAKPGEYIPVAVADTSTYAGSEYFVIGVVEHAQWMHSDLQKATTLRSYVQLYPRLSERAAGATNPPAKVADNLTGQTLPDPVALKYPNGTPITWPGSITEANPAGEQVYAYDNPHYLGPIILTMTGTPVRTQMVNLLPAGRAVPDGAGSVLARNGDMFLPVDESLGGAGVAPAALGNAPDKYPQNRVGFHLHGGDSPWISDGTPHQWITPASDPSTHKSGNRALNVPDMPFPGEGSLTLFWPNDQSARLMWYHDHTFGLTRQNAYSGEAAGYVIMDPAEMALLNGGTVNGNTIKKAIPNDLLNQIVLVIQDKSFVPTDIAVQDAKWDTKAWGQPGDLWFPHVYEPFQLWGTSEPVAGTDPAFVGINPAGRWDYAVNDLDGTYLPPRVGATRLDPDYGMVAFPDGSYADGTPGKGPSATPESYMDTPVVNGVAYPVLNVEPKAYRVRFLNGSNDRYFNLSLWKADSSVTSSDGRSNTEVKIVPAGQLAADGVTLNTSNDPAGIPDPSTAGPSIIQFANESGFLPTPVVHKPTLMSFDINGEEIAGDFYLAAAERADTVIDFSQFAGQTLIMYNDGTAPVPGGDPRYDYYTGDADQTAAGGAPSTQAGFGPNTRTLMQIRVAPTLTSGKIPKATDAYDPAGNGGALATELPKAYAAVADQHIVTGMPQAVNAASSELTLADGQVVPLTIKTIHGFTDSNVGRLIAQLGTELPDANGASVPTPLSYIDMPTEILHPDQVQYWWIKNYDVDNHPMHFHLFNVQVLAHRLHADGSLRPPTEEEMGWKETVKNWPGEDVVVALRPKTPQLPFGLPNSVRTLDPTMYEGATANDVLYGSTLAGGNIPFAFNQSDLDATSPSYGAPKAVANSSFNFGWEYVWHCHILGHEENDLMRPMAFYPVVTLADVPTNLSVSASGKVRWTDPTPALDGAGNANAQTKGNNKNEIGFRVERAVFTGTGSVPVFAALPAANTVMDMRVNTLANATSYADTPAADADYQYRVVAVNEAGESFSDIYTLEHAPLAASGLSVAAAPAPTARTLTLNWIDNSNNEDGFSVQASADAGLSWFTVAAAPVAANVTNLAVTGLQPATAYQFRVAATKATLADYVPSYTTVRYSTPMELLAPVVTAQSTMDANGLPLVDITWTDTSTGESGYTVERCAGTTTSCAKANAVWSLLSASLPAGSTSYRDSSAVSGTTYVYRVKAVNGASAGPIGTSTQTLAASKLLAPANLTATSATGASVTLSWTDNSPNETSFTVMRAPAASGNFTVLASVARTSTLKLATGGAVSYADASVVAGVAYDYQVIAVNTTGTTVSNSQPSNTATVTPSVPAPTGLTASVATGTAVVLNWVDSTSSETAFQVVRTDANGASTVFTTPARSTTQTTATGGAVSYSDASALPMVNYSYAVAAITSAAGVTPVVTGALSAPAAASLALNAPTLVSASQAATGISVGWTDNANNESGYQIVRTDAAGATTVFTVASTATQKTAVAAVRSYADTTALPGVSYTYAVATSGGSATAPVYSAAVASNTVTATVAAPGLPSAVISSANRITLSWTDLSTNETGFLIERSTDGGQQFAALTTLARTAAASKNTNVAASYVDNLVAPVTQGAYLYRVSAVNQSGTVTNASSAAVLSNTVDFTAPLAPSALAASAGATGTVSLSWTDNAANGTGFSVQRASNTSFTTGLTTSTVSGAAAGTGASKSYLVSGLTKGKLYYFRVATTNVVGASVYSGTASITAP